MLCFLDWLSPQAAHVSVPPSSLPWEWLGEEPFVEVSEGARGGSSISSEQATSFLKLPELEPGLPLSETPRVGI